jgi:unsaturated rhamnogalacturonyl hydrolase
VRSLVIAAARVAAVVGFVSACGGGTAGPGANAGGAGATSTAGGSSAGANNVPAGGQQAAGSAGATGGSDSNTSGGSAGASSAGAAGATAGGGGGSAGQASTLYPPAADVLEVLDRVNTQFAAKWPDPGAPIVVGSSRPSNIWTRAVYYEGLLGLYGASPKPAYLDYALSWGNAHAWQLRNNDSTTTNADNQCAGQAYIDLYNLDGGKDAKRITAIQQSIDGMLKSSVTNAWTWVDAIQMSMPVFARFGVLRPEGGYFDAMYALYSHPKHTEGQGLYNTTDHLWWRDANWKSQKSPNNQQVYWSRGNGWVFAALARVLEILPETDPHRAEYTQDFKDMASALLKLQRDDGFWNPSLKDPMHFGGPESSGTSLFVYGMAWGVRRGLLDEATYAPALVHAWTSLVKVAVHPNGFIGYMQSSGDDPSDGQPLTFDKVPDFEDYGVGCFLLAGSELVKLSKK